MGTKNRSGLKRRLLAGFAVASLSALLLIILSQTSIFEQWELKTYDLRMTATRNDRAKPSNVALFYVDEPSLRYMEGQGVNWPWPRELYASALDFCRRGGAKAVIFDIFYSEPSVYGVDDDAAFAAGVAQGPSSYFVLFISKNKTEPDSRLEDIFRKSAITLRLPLPPWFPNGESLASLPIAPLVKAAKGFGNAQIPPDSDGVYRRFDLVGRVGDKLIPSIGLKAVMQDNTATSLDWTTKDSLNILDTTIPLDSSGRMMINYYGGVGSFPSYSLAQVILSDTALSDGNKPDLDPSIIKDKIVIIGLAAPGLYDTKSTPFSRVYPGSEIHATIIENLISHDFLQPVHSAENILIIVLSGFAVAIGLAWITRPSIMIIYIVAITSAFVAAAFVTFKSGIWMPFVAPFGTILLTSFGTNFYNYLTEGRQKREIRRAFGQYLSPHVVSQIAADPQKLALGGEVRKMTLFFSDIADFTSISEKTTPSVLVEQLNAYFSTTTRIIQNNHGTLDKYIGDAIMAFWGAPLEMEDQALRAVTSAMAIQVALKTSAFKTRIGIHTGEAVVGNIGSDVRFNYTAIGDTVNLASRLEGLNKKFGTHIIVSETSFANLADRIEARRLGRVRVKGRNEPIGIFEPLGEKNDFGRFNVHAVSLFSEALTLFESGDFQASLKIFTELEQKFADQASIYYKNMITAYLDSPPTNFDGVITFTSK